jgi:hypothetical protein
MNNGTTLIERVPVVVVALAVVLSVVGGAAAVAGPSTEDGTLQDGGATAGNVSSDNETTDEVDNVTDTAGGITGNGTLQDGGATAGNVSSDDETTDEVDDVMDTAGGITGDNGQVEDDAIPTDGVDDATESPTGTGPPLPRGTDDVAGSDSTRQTRTSTDGSGTAGSADPASVGVTAGATNQTAIETAGEGPATLQFTESESGDFPDNGTAHLTLPDGAGVTFDIPNSSAVASGDNASATVTNVSATAVTIQVNSTDDANSSLRLEGLRFTVTAAASPANATWTFGNTSGTTTVEPERLVFDGFDDDVPRGTAKVPEDETEIVVRAPDDARSTGFHESRDVIAIVIPDEYADDIVFNTSSDVQVTSEGGDCGLPPLGAPRPEEYDLTESTLLVEPSCDIGREARIEASGLQFDVTGANASEPAEFAVDLDGEYDPVNSTEKVPVTGGSTVEAHAPVVDPGGATMEAGTTNSTGGGGVRVSITDDVGGLMGNDTRITLELEDGGVTFDESQDIEAVSVSGDTPPPSVVDVSGTTIVLETNGETDAGDKFRIQRSGGEALRFDAAPDANDTALRVTTTPGAENVTQVTGEVVAITECSSVPQAIAGEDDRVGNSELAYAVDLWREGDEVPGTCGETIDNAQISSLKDAWRTGETVNDS